MRTLCPLCQQPYKGRCIFINGKPWVHSQCYETLKDCSLCGYGNQGTYCEDCRFDNPLLALAEAFKKR